MAITEGYKILYGDDISGAKPVEFQGSSLEDLRAFPLAAFGVTQPRVADLMRGMINLFALDALVNMAVAAGLHIEMRVPEAA